MIDDNIVILHVFQDSLLFSGVANSYDTLEGVKNLYYFFSPQKDYKFQNIKDERVKIIHDFNEYIGCFSNPKIDVVVFHSMPSCVYYLFDYIDEKKFVVWWAWGYDIYYKQGKYPPIIPMEDILKPLTKQFVEKNIDGLNNSLVYKIRDMAIKAKSVPKLIIRKLFGKEGLPVPKKTQEEILARIDAFYSPLDIEYEMLKETHPSFNAKMSPKIHKQWNVPFVKVDKNGNVLVNHSLTHTDNHLDVFEYLNKVKIDNDRKFILPVSYGIGGNYKGNPDLLIKASRFEEGQAMWLKKVLPNNEYREILNTVSHAVFGAMRQQALGNIYICLRTGVKVFLFKDSMVYKELKKMGYVCFTIEDDLNTESLSTCLDEQNAKRNHDIFVEYVKNNSPEKLRDFLVNAIAEKQNG